MSKDLALNALTSAVPPRLHFPAWIAESNSTDFGWGLAGDDNENE